PTSELTRNLVGTTVTSAVKLNGLDGKPGIYFIFHDLSVRKDGVFRLRFSFFDLGQQGKLTKTTTSVKVQALSDPFTVYSAKKFPGMIESSPLSICFSKQGVKIPVRKDSSRSRGAIEDGDNEDSFSAV
ncbi:hypothetical protein EV182_004552, partial [Spiromyces aspiralis]